MSYMSLYGAVIQTFRAGGILPFNSFVLLKRNKKRIVAAMS